MRVHPVDGCCRSCGGTLVITDVDDVVMAVECEDCGDNYDVETDAFGDGGMTYYPAFLAAKLHEEGGPPP